MHLIQIPESSFRIKSQAQVAYLVSDTDESFLDGKYSLSTESFNSADHHSESYTATAIQLLSNHLSRSSKPPSPRQPERVSSFFNASLAFNRDFSTLSLIFSDSHTKDTPNTQPS
jgi:hypothetical protein